jgi:hypothetical protein
MGLRGLLQGELLLCFTLLYFTLYYLMKRKPMSVIFSILYSIMQLYFSYPFKNTHQLKDHRKMLYGQYLLINKVQ